MTTTTDDAPGIRAEIQRNLPYVLAAMMRYSGVLALGVTLGVLLSGDVAYQACISVPMPTDTCHSAMDTLAWVEKIGAVSAGFLLLGGALLDAQTSIQGGDSDG